MSSPTVPIGAWGSDSPGATATTENITGLLRLPLLHQSGKSWKSRLVGYRGMFEITGKSKPAVVLYGSSISLGVIIS
jgi:hypothetical protein